MKYLNKSFAVSGNDSSAYRKNVEKIFKRSEQEIKKSILNYFGFGKYPYIELWENQSQGTYDAKIGCYRKNNRRQRGVSDLIGWIDWRARWFAIEVKTPEGLKKFERNKLIYRKDNSDYFEWEWGQKLIRAGGVYIVATSYQMVLEQLEKEYEIKL